MRDGEKGDGSTRCTPDLFLCCRKLPFTLPHPIELAKVPKRFQGSGPKLTGLQGSQQCNEGLQAPFFLLVLYPKSINQERNAISDVLECSNASMTSRTPGSEANVSRVPGSAN